MNMNQQSLQIQQQQQQLLKMNQHLQSLFSKQQLGSIFSLASQGMTPSSSHDTPGQKLITAGFDSGAWSSSGGGGLGDLHMNIVCESSSHPTQQSQGGGLCFSGGNTSGAFNTNNTVYQSPFFHQQQYQSNSSEIERMFHKAYFDQLMKVQEQQAPGNIITAAENGYGSIGHQDFASNEEELSSIAASSPGMKEIRLDEHLSKFKDSGQKVDEGKGNIDKQIRQIMRVIGKLNSQDEAYKDDIIVEQDKQVMRTSPLHQMIADKSSGTVQDAKKVVVQKKRSMKGVSRNSKSPLQRFLTSQQPQASHVLNKVASNVQIKNKSLLRPKQPLQANQPIGLIPNLKQSPRFLNTPTTQQKIQSAIQTLSSLTISASGGKLNQNQNQQKSSTTSQRSGGRLRSSIESKEDQKIGEIQKEKKSIHQKPGTRKDEFLSQDLISRLFINHQRQQEVQDQKKYIQLQKEVEDVQDRPTISPRSRDIALSSERFHLPIYNNIRYRKEIQTYLSRKEEAKRLKYLLEKQKEMEDENEMRAFFNRSHSQKRLNQDDFLRKYNNQVQLWENRIRSGSSKLKGSRNASQKTRNDNIEEEEELSFTPKINQRSKQLAKDIERLENRVQKLQEQKKRKIDMIQTLEQPSFHPQINPISEMIAQENRKNSTNGKNSTGRRTGQSPYLKRYLSSMKEIADQTWKENSSATSQNNITHNCHSRKSLEGTQSIQGRLKDIATSSKLSKSSQFSKSSTNIHKFENKKFQKLLSPVRLSRPRQIEDKISDQDNLLRTQLNLPIIANITQNIPQGSLNLLMSSTDHPLTESHKVDNSSRTNKNNPSHHQQEDQVLYEEFHQEGYHSEENKSIIQPNNEQYNPQTSANQDYIQGILSNTQNLEAYLQQYLMMQSVNTQASSDGEIAQVSVVQPNQRDSQLNILQEYLKIKKEMDEQIKSRLRGPAEIQDKSNDQVQIVRESQSTMVVKDHSSFIKEILESPNKDQIGETIRDEDESSSNLEEVQNDKQYAIDFAGTLGPTSQIPLTNQDYQTVECHNLTSSQELSNMPYQSSPTNQVLYTVSSSFETAVAADEKNLQVLKLQSMSDATLQNCCAGPGSQLKHLLLVGTTTSVTNSLRDSLLRDHVPSKELIEAETILQNIKQSLRSMNESSSGEQFRASIDPKSSLQVHPFSLKVEEVENESSNDSSEGDEFVERARKTSLTQAVGNQMIQFTRQWSDAIDSNNFKQNKDYHKIMSKRRGGTVKVAQKKNQSESIHQEAEISKTRKESESSPQLCTTHRKSPTHDQIHKIRLEQQNSARLLGLNSIGSSASNPVSDLNQEQNEETKQEHSQALTYQSGGFMKGSVSLPEDYSLNTWNSPTKGATTTSASQTINQQYNNIRQYDSAFRAHLFQQLSEQKLSEIALYVDQETKQMIENSRSTFLQTIEKDPYFFPQSESGIFKNDSNKQDEIVKKLVLSNQKQFNPFQREVPTSKIGPLNIPPEVYQEIEENGLDTLAIIQSVILQFKDVLEQSKNQPKMKLRQQMKSAEQKYHSSMFVTFNKSKPQ